eukprot:1609166-Pyramimonas_sp.AAC.1
MPLPPMPLHPQEAAPRGSPARARSDAGAMETEALAQAKARARAKIRFAALPRKRASARVGRT